MTTVDIGKLFEEVLKDHPRALWGVCELDFTEFKDKYKYAGVIVVPYRELITLDDYSETRIFEIMKATGADVEAIEGRLKEVFDEAGADWFMPEILEEDVNRGWTPLSNKYTAVKSGLGWIGKNGLLITPQYGPRMHMIGLLFNGEVEVGTPVTESYCGDCVRCVKNCLFKVLRGTTWNIDTARDDMVDFKTCHEKRLMFREKLGKKLTCAKCVASCGYGTEIVKASMSDFLADR